MKSSRNKYKGRRNNVFKDKQGRGKMFANDWAELKNQIKNYASSIGIDKIGFTDAEPLLEHLPRLMRRQKAGYRYGIREGDPVKRINPRVHLAGAKSVISVGVAYPWRGPILSNAIEKRGHVSSVSRGRDYHLVVKIKLEKLRDFILGQFPDAQIKLMVDKEEILEKALAVKAGLGWFGKNTLLITPEFGSWIFLGELVTDIPFPSDQPLNLDCGGCRQCVQACPTGAITEGEDLNLDRCLACVTLMKDLPQEELREKMAAKLYGCDACQLVCPHNKAAGAPDHSEFAADPEDVCPNLSSLMTLSNADFKKRFGHTSGAWRGRTPFQRNAVIAAGNLKDDQAVPVLVRILKSDSRPVLRGAAAWALGKIGGQRSMTALEKSLNAEEHPEVVKEIRESLAKMKKRY